MKTLTKCAVLAIFTSLIGVGQTKAQVNKTDDSYVYENAIGVRLGGTTGFTFKHRRQQNAFEAIIGTYPYAFGVTGLYERYFSTSTDGLNLYFGAGGHIARPYRNVYAYYYRGDRYYFYRDYAGPVLGIDLIGGIEYKIPSAPLALSFDIKPTTEFYRDYSPIFSLDPGLGIKFTF